MTAEVMAALDKQLSAMREEKTNLLKIKENIARMGEELARMGEELASMDEELARAKEVKARYDENYARKVKELARIEQELAGKVVEIAKRERENAGLEEELVEDKELSEFKESKKQKIAARVDEELAMVKGANASEAEELHLQHEGTAALDKKLSELKRKKIKLLKIKEQTLRADEERATVEEEIATAKEMKARYNEIYASKVEEPARIEAEIESKVVGIASREKENARKLEEELAEDKELPEFKESKKQKIAAKVDEELATVKEANASEVEELHLQHVGGMAAMDKKLSELKEKKNNLLEIKEMAARVDEELATVEEELATAKVERARSYENHDRKVLELNWIEAELARQRIKIDERDRENGMLDEKMEEDMLDMELSAMKEKLSEVTELKEKASAKLNEMLAAMDMEADEDDDEDEDHVENLRMHIGSLANIAEILESEIESDLFAEARGRLEAGMSETGKISMATR